MDPGWAGTDKTGLTASWLAVPFPQLLEGVTMIIPALLPTITVMLFPVAPPEMLQPAGSDQLYVTPGVLTTE